MNNRKLKSILTGGLFLAVFFIAVAITGSVDYNAYNGIHKVSGTVINGKVQDYNGNVYSAASWETGSKVTLTLDGDGAVVSIATNK